MRIEFRSATESDARAISELTLHVCEQAILFDASPEARLHLQALYHEENLRVLIQDGNPFLLAIIKNELVGAVAMNRETARIFLLFVAERFQRRGLGMSLIRRLLSGESENATVTLNSSMFAVGFYKSLGFTACGPVTCKHGLTYLPMKKSGEIQ